MDSTHTDHRDRSLMGMQVSDRASFMILWIVTNIFGFMIGSVLGATDNGLVSHILPNAGIITHMLGDIVFGACFGFAQSVVLYYFFPKSRSHLFWWILACMIGFTIGARLGARFAPAAGTNEVLVGAAFGVLMGGSLGVVQWLAIKGLGTLKTVRPLVWIPASIVAWLIGESIAFHFRFELLGVPLVALAIALVSGIALLWWIEPT